MDILPYKVEILTLFLLILSAEKFNVNKDKFV